MKAYVRYWGIADEQDPALGSCYVESRCRMTLLPEHGESPIESSRVKSELEEMLTRAFQDWLQQRGIRIIKPDLTFETTPSIVVFGGPMA